METPPATESTTPVKPARFSKRNILIVCLLAVIVVLVLIIRHPFKNEANIAPVKKEPLFHRDEPAKEQIFQGDYEQKVYEMLDSGKSVGEISRETGIRRDVIKKIKKAKDEKQE